MRTLRIRKFTVLSLFFILTMPWVFFVAAHLIETGTLSFGINEAQQKNLDRTVHLIETNTDRWKDPAWQNQLRSRLQKTNMDVVILSALDQKIFQSTSDHSLRSTQQFSVIENGRLIGRVIIYLSNSNVVQMLAAFAGLLLAFFIVGYEMRRFILKPLEKMSQAALKIAKGDFNVRLPASRITEIARVRDGFDVMVKGLQESFQKQMESEEERRFVIGALAHDLRTPLFALRGYLDGLEQGIANSPEKMAKYLSVCREKSAQLDRLVEDLFAFTKTEYMETELNKNTVDLVCVLQKSIDSLSPLAREKHISITKQLADHCLVNGDSHLLERAVSNLLDNAVKYTPTNGEIFVHCHKDGHNAIFTIQDTGAGFSSEELQHVFEPLYRGELSRNRSTGGAGLGLTISQRIIDRHGGELVAENHSDGGALLTGWIPVANNRQIV
jgi:signal transduction histidine kinase